MGKKKEELSMRTVFADGFNSGKTMVKMTLSIRYFDISFFEILSPTLSRGTRLEK
jgi:hypothetical protein